MRRVSRILLPTAGVVALLAATTGYAVALPADRAGSVRSDDLGADAPNAPGTGAATTNSTTNPWPGRTDLNIAHQGGALEAPGNTLAAFRTALENGADVLEFDVQQTADGELVVLHDDTVDRTTDGQGRVDELTREELAELDAAYWFVPGCGACDDRDESEYVYRGFATGDRPIPPELGLESADFRVPTLRQVLEAFPNTYLNIEIKQTGYEKELADLLAEYGRSDDTIVTSFHESAMSAFAEHDPGVGTAPGPVTIGVFAAASLGPLPGVPLPGYHALQLPTELEGFGTINADLIGDAHRHDLAVHVWTLNERAEMTDALALGVDGIMTDRPSLLDEVLTEH